jgi:transposase-like protein
VESKKQTGIQLLESGLHVREIAARLGVSIKTVYGWRAEYRNELIQELETLKYIDLFSDKLDELDRAKNLCLKLASRISGTDAQYDPEKDEVVSEKPKYREFSELMRLHHTYLKTEIELLSRVGFIPAKAEMLSDRVSTEKPEVVSDELSQQDRDTLKERALKSLKEMKDQLIL